MSKVKIQGNASGTGIFTVAAPATNTDRTITLPDVDATVLTTAGGTITNALTISNPLAGYAFAARIGDNTNQKYQYRCLGNNNAIEGSIGLSSNDVNNSDLLIFGYGSGSTRIGRESNTHVLIDSLGRMTIPNQPFAYVTYSGAALVRGSTIPLQVQQQNGTYWNNSNYRFTCPVAGVYHASVNIVGNTTQSVQVLLRIRLNGGSIAYTYYPGNGTSISIKANANDYIDFAYEHDNAGYDGASIAQASVVLIG